MRRNSLFASAICAACLGGPVVVSQAPAVLQCIDPTFDHAGRTEAKAENASWITAAAVWVTSGGAADIEPASATTNP
jgi:hypothetical protein